MASVTEPTEALDAVNPMGTDGFEFVEYAAPDPAALGALFDDPRALRELRAIAEGGQNALERRQRALRSLAVAGDCACKCDLARPFRF